MNSNRNTRYLYDTRGNVIETIEADGTSTKTETEQRF
jgi:YD repeat-containing protein